MKLKVKRTLIDRKPRSPKPNEWWGINLTRVVVVGGWGYLVVVLDWATILSRM
jgi:putative transposase